MQFATFICATLLAIGMQSALRIGSPPSCPRYSPPLCVLLQILSHLKRMPSNSNVSEDFRDAWGLENVSRPLVLRRCSRMLARKLHVFASCRKTPRYDLPGCGARLVSCAVCQSNAAQSEFKCRFTAPSPGFANVKLELTSRRLPSFE